MTKFNEKTVKEPVLNHMGAKAFRQGAKEELAMAVLTTFIDDSYYESKNDKLDRIHKLIDEVAAKDPEYVAKLAVFARTKFNMRSVFPVLIGRLTQVHRGDSLVSRAIEKGTTRPDDLTELASYLGLNLTNQTKKGISKALNKFNSYSLAKYRGEGKETKLVDLVNLVHPKVTSPDAKVALKALVAGTLKNEDTWEAQLSAGKDKAQTFKDLIRTNKLGYMALLRNLRNIQETGDQELIVMAGAKLMDEKSVLNSKQLPFRFLSAYKALEQAKPSVVGFEKDNSPILKKAVEVALELSIRHLPVLEGETLILSDNSGSMGGGISSGSPVSALSNTQTADIANLFATMYWLRSDNTCVGLFGDRLLTPKLDRSKSIFDNFKICTQEANKCGGGTEEGLFLAFEDLIKTKRKVARIVIFSDCQLGRGHGWYGTGGSVKSRQAQNFSALFKQYKEIHPGVKVYSVDLRGYGNSMTGVNEDIMCLAGWSEKIFDIMEKHEIAPGTLVKEIEEISI